MYRQVHEAVPRPGELNRAIGAELEGVLLRALAKEPGARYPTAEALGEVAAAEATRVMPAVPTGDSNDDNRQSAQRTAPTSPPTAVGQALAPGRSSGLAWMAALLTGILVLARIGVIVLLGTPGAGHNYRINAIHEPLSQPGSDHRQSIALAVPITKPNADANTHAVTE
jgi:serine/threonine-protein kinase